MKKLQKKILALIAKCPTVKLWYFGDIFGESIEITVWNGEQQLSFSFYSFQSPEKLKYTLAQLEELVMTLELQQKGGAA